MQKNIVFSLILILIAVFLVLSVFNILSYRHSHTSNPYAISPLEPPLEQILPSPPRKKEPEIKAILTTNDQIQRVKQYQHLIDRVGPIQAQDDLYFSGLPFDGQTHLLNHTVGEWLYKKYKSAGLVYCKDYFLSSCYHGFVIEAISFGGFKELNNVMEACWKAPPGVAYQCAHAIGHGLLAFDGYKNLIQALKDCDKVSTQSPNFPVYNCYDGVFMENIWGVHDGKPSPDRWVSYTDPIYPCDDPRINEKYIKACWSNQPQWMYQLFHGNLAKDGQMCLQLTNSDYKATCFDSIAREINPVSRGSVSEVFRLCDFMPREWISQCVISNAVAFFSVGDRKLPFIICSQMTDKKSACFSWVSGQIRFATQHGTEQRKLLCEKITDTVVKKHCLTN